MLRLLPALAAALALCLPAPAAHAAPGAGTLDDPVVVDAFPYAVAGTTLGAPSDQIDSYSCAPGLDESGPERIFRFSLPAQARVTAWVEGDSDKVDIDVHLLADAARDGKKAKSCAARDNVIAEAEMAAGEHYVVVDSYDGEAQAGPFVLHLEAIGDAWIERVVAQGVVWRARRFADLYGAQVVHELVVDTLQPDVEIRAVDAKGCQTVGAMGAAVGAVAGINGGYFTSGCEPVSLLKSGGKLLATNAVSRGAFGLTSDMAPLVELVAAGKDWPAAYETHGGGPLLVVGSAPKAGKDAWAAEGFSSGGFIGKNPRSFAGYDAQGRSHLCTVDGRRDNAAGMSLDELAAFAASAEIGLAEGVNLDGGGSTTMWILGATPSGVVSYPSDAPQEDQKHPGSRPCSGGLFVLAPEYNHPPRFQTEPPTEAEAGKSYLYDADAIDLDVNDIVTFALLVGPEGMSVDAPSGLVQYAASAASPPSAAVTLRASDDRGAYADQSFTLAIQGGMGAAGQGGTAGGDGGGGAAATGGAAGEGGAAAAEVPPDAQGAAPEGCGCRTGGAPGPGLPGRAGLALAVLLALLGRRGRPG
ncbi:MAG: phosphodiester glycosidase family protein [Deltaproteobacteria bacterium]|nr:phosphodiester glycosidase family protein [Deltaproteobacteria bacterium]